eukprot:CAMPEP_0177638912 /NCGR_PEP_ID=MMETSP0447-20121125/5743_1 /TAXON_ID=0 /ORGANISM="Stygamoeba regulata, Strain BSH-02190019" /LENGTH=200 /DNA_ID=CAMNT_0019140909 /DNA_START=80 /DNA_END=682 /DNA_ORIENTATION=-
MPLFNFLDKQGGTVLLKPNKGTARYSLRKSMKMSLNSGLSLQDTVKLPEGEDRNEWIAMNTMELFEVLSLVYSSFGAECTRASCPVMTAGESVEYRWQEGKETPQRVSARDYIVRLTNWIQSLFDDEAIFPVEGAFTKDFLPTVKLILKRMFRIYAHMYHSHFQRLKQLQADAHFITCFRHFYYFVKEFNLVSMTSAWSR